MKDRNYRSLPVRHQRFVYTKMMLDRKQAFALIRQLKRALKYRETIGGIKCGEAALVEISIHEQVVTVHPTNIPF